MSKPNDAPELLPCPFCGGTAIDPEGWSTTDGIKGPSCDDCGASVGDLTHSTEVNIAMWNQRAAPSPAATGVEDLLVTADDVTHPAHLVLKSANLRIREAYGRDRERWVSAKDGLPADRDAVLGFSDYYVEVVVFRADLHHSPNGSAWQTHSGTRVKVTHWMPLPAPPKEATNGDK